MPAVAKGVVSQQFFESDPQLKIDSLSSQLALAKADSSRQLDATLALASRMEEILAALPNGVLVVDRSGLIIECNSSAVELLGEPLLGERWEAVFSVRFHANTIGTREYRLCCGRYVNLTAKHLDQTDASILVISEVTENRQMAERLHRQDRLASMGEVSARLAHQMRTPLASALLYLSHLDHARVDARHRNKAISSLRSSMQHMEKQVKDMLLFTRGGSCGEETLIASDLMIEAMTSLEAQAQQAGHLLLLGACNRAVRIQGNRETLVDVLQNLVMNALESAEQQATITLSVKCIGQSEVQLEVVDTGPGINSEILDKIFEPFFTTRENGTGLGLAVAKTVVSAHGGRIDCFSAPNVGTTFSIRLPSYSAEIGNPDRQNRAIPKRVVDVEAGGLMNG